MPGAPPDKFTLVKVSRGVPAEPLPASGSAEIPRLA
jgi:hypothetical protein